MILLKIIQIKLTDLRVYCDKVGIESAAKIVSEGGVIIYPTDTVYGIGCDPFNEKAVRTVYKIKKRSREKPFPVLGFSREEISNVAIFDEVSEKLAKKFWPGQLTLILKLKDSRLRKTLRIKEKIAVRVPDNKCALDLLKKCKLLVGTSANVSGMRSFRDPDECEKNLLGYDLLVDGGAVVSSLESTILECEKENLEFHRIGSIGKEEILNSI